MLRLCIAIGFQMIVCGGDVGFMVAGSKQASADARKIIGQATPSAGDSSAAAKSIY